MIEKLTPRLMKTMKGQWSEGRPEGLPDERYKPVKIVARKRLRYEVECWVCGVINNADFAVNNSVVIEGAPHYSSVIVCRNCEYPFFIDGVEE